MKSFCGVGVLALGNPEMTAERVVDALGALDVAGGADADVDDVLARRLMAELIVERRDAGDRGRRDLRQLADPPQGLFRQIAVVSLEGLEDLQHLLGAGADPLDGLIDECQITGLPYDSIAGLPMQ